MGVPPDDPLVLRLQAYWKLLIVVAAGILGLAIVISDALLHPPIDPATSGLGVLLMGIVPAAAADALRGRNPP